MSDPICVGRGTRALLITALMLWAMARLASQTPLASARDLYAAARYEEALAVLGPAAAEQPALASEEHLAVQQLRMFCLLALGRAADAEQAIAAMVEADPGYRADDAEISPRIRTAFRDVRQRLLPDIAQREYGEAKAAYDRKEHARAIERFRALVELLDDPDMQGKLSDLKTLAAGFLELSVAAVAPPPPPPPDPPPPLVDPAVRIYDSTDTAVIPPQAIRQDLPQPPASIARDTRDFGTLEIIVSEKGSVESAAMVRSMSRKYDALLMEATRSWRYRPGTLDGRPVKYRRLVQVRFDASSVGGRR